MNFKMKKSYILILFLVLLLPVMVSGQAYTLLQPDVAGNIQTVETTSDFLNYVSNIISTILVIIVVLSVVVFTWGALEYTASGIPGMKSNGRERMMYAIGGLVLALASWLILFTINPQLVNLNLSLDRIQRTPQGGLTTTQRPTTPSTPSQTGPGLGQGRYGPVPSNEFEVRGALNSAGISINDDGVCQSGNLSGCRTYVGGLDQRHLNGVFDLRDDCGCSFVITGAAEQGGHSANSRHYSGQAIDIRQAGQINNYMRNYINTNCSQTGTRGSNTFYGCEGGGGVGITRIINEGSHWHIEF